MSVPKGYELHRDPAWTQSMNKTAGSWAVGEGPLNLLRNTMDHPRPCWEVVIDMEFLDLQEHPDRSYTETDMVRWAEAAGLLDMTFTTRRAAHRALIAAAALRPPPGYPPVGYT